MLRHRGKASVLAKTGYVGFRLAFRSLCERFDRSVDPPVDRPAGCAMHLLAVRCCGGPVRTGPPGRRASLRRAPPNLSCEIWHQPCTRCPSLADVVVVCFVAIALPFFSDFVG